MGRVIERKWWEEGRGGNREKDQGKRVWDEHHITTVMQHYSTGISN